jgi:hypothetical protein
MNQLTDKTMVVITKTGEYWITAQQVKNIQEIKQKTVNGYIELDGNLILVNNIGDILTPEKYFEYNLLRRGGWQCKYGYWHERNQGCAHEKRKGS